MLPFPAKTPSIVKWLFGNYIWHLNTDEKSIYLTFDDGPTPAITEWVLKTLKAYNAKATFFCIGSNARAYPEILKRITADKHSIGNHTNSHLKGWRTNTSLYTADVLKAKEILLPFTSSVLMRPPYGQLKYKQGETLLAHGFSIIMWDVISYDWSSKVSEERCLEHVIKHTENGSIVVFHDSVKAAKNMQYALPKVLRHFTDLGYAFKGIPEQLQ